MNVKKLYDITIIGAGPAGMTAAIYAARANKSVALLDKNGFGGQIAKSPKVENIPGFSSISGVDFATSMFEQVSAFENIDYIEFEVCCLDYRYGIFKVVGKDNSVICSKSIIIASGCKPKELGLASKNVHYCVTCDGPFYKGKSVLVVGSGNTGATYALELASYCKQVYICDITETLMCEPVLAQRIKDMGDKIVFLPKTTVKKSVTDDKNNLIGVVFNDDAGIKISAVFSAAGQSPETNFVGNFANVDNRGYIISGSSIAGVFACGDCTDEPVKQVVTACGSGARAALAAINFLNGSNK